MNDAAAKLSRLTRQGQPDVPLTLSEGGAAILRAAERAETGESLGVMIWPGGPRELGAAFAMAALRAQARGAGNFRAVIYPWHGSGQVASMRQLMVDEAPLVSLARGRIAARGASPSPEATGLASYDLLALRLATLGGEAQRMKGRRRSTNLPPEARHPTLADLFPIFAPGRDPREGYANAGGSFLGRIRDYTDIPAVMGDELFAHHASIVGDPSLSPYALFGVPPAKGELMGRWLDRINGAAPRVLFVDAGDQGRTGQGGWRGETARFIDAARERWPGVGVVAVTDDPKTLREMTTATRTRPRPMVSAGELVLSSSRSLTSAAGGAAGPAAEVRTKWSVAPKDKSVLGVVHEGMNLMSACYDDGMREAGAASWALAKSMQALTNAPCGWESTRDLLDRDFGGQVPEAISKRHLPTLHLQRVMQAVREGGPHADRMKALIRDVNRVLPNMRHATPVSNTLRRLMETMSRSGGARRLVFAFRTPDHVRHFNALLRPTLSREVLSRLGDRVLATHREELRILLDRGDASKWVSLILVDPQQQDIGVVMSARKPPGNATILTDASSAVALVRDLSVVSRIGRGSEWAPVLSALAEALERDIEALPDLKRLFERHEPDTRDERVAEPTLVGPRADLSILTDDGDDIRCAATMVLVHNEDGGGTPFRRVRASAVEEGDTILVPSEDISPTLTAALRALDRDEADQRRTLAEYHHAVRTLHRRMNWSERGREHDILERMRRDAPELEDGEIANIRRWTSVEPGQDVPQAPGDRRRFEAFASALGMDTARTERYWEEAILPWRDLKRVNGQDLYQRAVGFLSDPDSAAIRLGLGNDAYDAVMAETAVRMRRVREIRVAFDPRRTASKEVEAEAAIP